METKEIIRDFKEIKEDYKYNPDIMNPDDERVSKLKEIINTRLSVVDKTLILLYVDCQSYRKLGKRLGLSHMTCRREIVRIKQIILKEYGNLH
jgi:DNA-directed RNA polymerase specialized sigma24 family protein